MSRASQRIAPLLGPEPGMRVLDACAAPGGKSGHLAELLGDAGAGLLCVEQDPRRCDALRETLRALRRAGRRGGLRRRAAGRPGARPVRRDPARRAVLRARRHLRPAGPALAPHARRRPDARRPADEAARGAGRLARPRRPHRVRRLHAVARRERRGDRAVRRPRGAPRRGRTTATATASTRRSSDAGGDALQHAGELLGQPVAVELLCRQRPRSLAAARQSRLVTDQGGEQPGARPRDRPRAARCRRRARRAAAGASRRS